MKLEDIGFYTLSDARAQTSSIKSPLWRCELILTDACNFRCTYCRGQKTPYNGTLPFEEAERIVRYWLSEGMRNVRFSGGEPTLYPGLAKLVKICKDGNCDHVAISTNGSANIELYRELIEAGVNDFSISLDSGCCSIGEAMSGGKVKWKRLIDNIRALSQETYVTVGMVFTEDNVANAARDVAFAGSLGVSDIRVIPSAQYNQALMNLVTLPDVFLARYPILKYRVENLKNGVPVRGITEGDSHKCHLAIDDMVVVAGYHFPCVIHFREGGAPIGKIGTQTRQERADWIESHDPQKDPICKAMCLDVCMDFNRKACSRIWFTADTHFGHANIVTNETLRR